MERNAPSSAAAPPSSASGLAPWLAFPACTLIWSSTFLFISIGNEALPPLWAVSLRLALAALLLGGIARVTNDGMPRGAAALAATGYGLCQFGIGFPLLYWGETVLPSGLAAIIYATVPLWASLFTRAFGLERFSSPKLAGALVGLAGVAGGFPPPIRGGFPGPPFPAVRPAAAPPAPRAGP